MASTDIEICNLALIRVRGSPIQSFDENNAISDACKILYPLVLDEMLEIHHWGFATSSKPLSLQSEKPTEWQYSFDYPNDCVDTRYLTIDNVSAESFDKIPFAIWEGSDDRKKIFTDVSEPVLVYTKRVKTVTQYSALFVQAFAWRMAIDLAITVGGDAASKYADRAEQKFPIELAKAVASDLNGQKPKDTRLPRAIEARGMGSRFRNRSAERIGY